MNCKRAHRELSHFRGSTQNLGTNIDEYRAKPGYKTSENARQTNYLACLLLPWAQEAPGSNPGAPTTSLIWRPEPRKSWNHVYFPLVTISSWSEFPHMP
jgi:hypothetical protein